jgi:hypothetical protein
MEYFMQEHITFQLPLIPSLLLLINYSNRIFYKIVNHINTYLHGLLKILHALLDVNLI